MDGTGGGSDAANAVVEEIKAAGGEAIANGGSVSDPAGAQSMVTDAMDAYGRVDILINNAGILRDKSFAKMTMEDFRLVMEVQSYWVGVLELPRRIGVRGDDGLEGLHHAGVAVFASASSVE